MIPDGSKYILDRRMRGEEGSTGGYFSLDEGPGYFRDEGTRSALRSAQGEGGLSCIVLVLCHILRCSELQGIMYMTH